MFTKLFKRIKNNKLLLRRIISKNYYNEINFLYFLLFFTIISHFIAWFYFLLVGNETIWIHSERVISQRVLFYPGVDGGYLEHFQYIILSWNFLLAFYIASRNKYYSYSIPLLYLFLFVDDCLSLHDFFIDQYLIPILQKSDLYLPIIFRVKDFGELFYWLIVLLIFVCISIPDLYRSSFKIKNYIKVNYYFLSALIFFSIVLDTINANLGRWSSIFSDNSLPSVLLLNIRHIIYIAEELGEVSVITFLFLWLFSLSSRLRYNRLS